MSTPVVEPVLTEDLPDLDIVHLVCCVTEPDMRAFCGEVMDPEDEQSEDTSLSCPGCIEAEEKQGVGACPRYAVCKHHIEVL